MGAGADDVLRRRRARPRVLRQAAGDDDQAGRAQRRRLVDIAPVVVAHLVAMRGIGGEQAAAAEA